MSDEQEFRLRPRRPRRQPKDENKAWSRAFKGLMHAVRMTSRIGKSSGGRRRPKSPRRAWRQRCAVRLTYTANRVKGQWRAHGRYVMRDSAALPGPEGARAFNADRGDIDMPSLLNEWQQAGDPRVFKLIVSPEFGERVDLKAHTRELLAAMSRDLNVQLEWAAVAHFNTGHPHVHVAIRGIADGHPLRFDREYIRHGIRQYAEEICTRQIGFRTSADALQAKRREVEQPRLTSLDRTILRHAQPSGSSTPHLTLDLRELQVHDPATAQLLLARMRVLASMGLASTQDAGSWSLHADLGTTLRAMQRLNDRQRLFASHSAMLSDPRLPVVLTPAQTIEHLEGRVIGHSHDDASGKTYLILEGIDARVHLIQQSAQIEIARSRGSLNVNHFVRLRRGQRIGSLRIQDLGNAEAYLSRLESRAVDREDGLPKSDWGGWLGRYQAVHRTGQTLVRGVTK